MAIDRYLAMTAAEIASNTALPAGLGYMACHFSPYGTGLSNCPASLPEGAMLILNDRTPICGHDPRRIAGQLSELVTRLKCGCVLLDFQRPAVEETAALSAALADALPCPTGVSDLYAGDLDCPVFLPPVPIDVRPEAYFAPWKGREIWLEMALDAADIILTPDGALTSPPLSVDPGGKLHHDQGLHCHYYIQPGETVRFALRRTAEDLDDLLAEAEAWGVTRGIGLFQELRNVWF